MTLSLTHKFVSTVPDGADTSVVRPSNWNDTHDVSGTLPVANGGTNTSATPANGQLLIGNGTDYTLANLTAGTGVTITNTAGGISISAPENGTVTEVTATSPLASSGGTAPDISLTGIVPIANGGTGASDAPTARANLSAAASGANSDITSLSGITGAISTVDSITFDTAAAVTVTTGQIAWNANDGCLDIGMGYDAVTQQVGLETYYRIKAGSAIADGQLVMFTGAVGASGVIIGEPTSTGLTEGLRIMGIATMTMAANDFGYVTAFGLVRGIDASGSSVGETWADGDILYYNPAYTGAMTNVRPTAPNEVVIVGAVVHNGSGGSGSIFSRSTFYPKLVELSDVYAPGPTNGKTLIYNATTGRWEGNTLTAGTGVNIVNGAGTITISAPDVGSVTSVDASGGTTGMTFSGGPITSSGTLTLGGTLAVGSGGTGQTSYTDGQLLIGNSTGNTLSKATLTAGTGVTITNGPGTITISAPDTGTVTAVTASSPLASSGGATPDLSLTGTVAIANGGTNTTTTPTAGAIAYGTGTAYAFTAAGTTGQVLTSNGAGAPTWSAAASGTVTSVAQSFTGGLISVSGSPITSSGTLALTVAGTSGGVPYFSSGTSWASTAAGTAGQFLKSNGAGAPTWADVYGPVYTKTDFTATAGQTTFSATYTVGYVDVYQNGSKLSLTEYTATNGTSVVLGTGAVLNDIIEIIAWTISPIQSPSNLTIGSTSVSSGTNGYFLYNNAGTLGNAATTGTGSVVLATSPTVSGLTVTGTTTPQGLLDISGAGAGQIKFPATQNASSDANTLDDYEEGTWTPTITGSGGSPQTSYLAQQGTYTKVGRLVNASFYVRANGALSGPTGNVLISGIPFAAGGASGERAGGAAAFVTQNQTYSGSGTTLSVYTDQGQSYFALASIKSGGSWFDQAVSDYGTSSLLMTMVPYIST